MFAIPIKASVDRVGLTLAPSSGDRATLFTKEELIQPMQPLDRFAVPPPAIWEDFERLCWALWREIWADPATQMNGRRGQKQRGVDIFGQPRQAASWAAIQCKAKDGRLGATLTIDEVQREVRQARSFKPFLTELTIATTSQSDAALQEQVRELSDELRAKGLFSVTVLSWDEILKRLSSFPILIEQYFPMLPQRRLTDGVRTLSSSFAGCIANFLAEYLGSQNAPIPFGGRMTTMEQLSAWLESDTAKPYMLLTAPAGRGKSAVLAKWVAGQSIRTDLHVVYLPISIRFRTNLRSVIFPSLAARLAHIHGDTPPSLADLPSEAGLGLVCDLLARPTPDGRPLLLILDGLDEAADIAPGPDLIPLAPWPGLRVIVAARSLAGDADRSGWLDTLGWADLDLAERIDLELLTLSGVTEVLQSMGNPLDNLGRRTDVVTAIHQLTDGDPLLVRLYVNDLRRRSEQAPDLRVADLRAFAPGFSGYIGRWWSEQRLLWDRSDRFERGQNEAVVRRILAILASALGPIMLEDLLQLLSNNTAMSRNRVRDCLAPLSRFIIGDGVSQGYTFSHPRMAIYFREEELTLNESQDARNLIRTWCSSVVSTATAGQIQPAAVPTYVIQYFGAHLEADAQQTADFEVLISAKWLAACRYHDRTLSGFLNDVNRAINAAHNELSSKGLASASPSSMSILLRGLLCHASANSLASKLTPKLLALLVEAEIWSPSQGLAYARRIADDWGLIDSLITLFPLLPEALLAECIDAIGLIRNETARVEAVLGISQIIPDALIRRVIDTAATLEDDVAKVDLIAPLKYRLNPADSEAAFGLTSIIRSEEELAKLLIVLAPSLPEGHVIAALEIALNLSDTEMREDALSCLLPKMATRSQVYDRVFQIVRQVVDERSRCRLLTSLHLAANTDDLHAIMSEILLVEDANIREASLAYLGKHRAREIAPILTELAPEMLEKSDRITAATAEAFNAGSREALASRLLMKLNDPSALCSLALLIPHLSDVNLDVAIAAALDQDRPMMTRVKLTIALIPYLPDIKLDLILAAILQETSKILDEGERLLFLQQLLPALPETDLKAGARQVMSIADLSIRLKLLSWLASAMPPLAYARITCFCVETFSWSPETFKEIVVLLPALGKDRLLIVLRAEKITAIEKLEIIKLSQKFLGMEAYRNLVMESISIFEMSSEHDRFCQENYNLLPSKFQEELIARAQSAKEQSLRHERILAFAPHIAIPLRSRILLDVLDDLQTIADSQHVRAERFRLSEFLPDEQLSTQLADITRTPLNQRQLSTFKSILHRLPEHLLEFAIAAAGNFSSPESQKEALGALMELETARTAALEQIRKLRDPWLLSIWLTKLIQHGRVELLDEVFELIEEMRDSQFTAYVSGILIACEMMDFPNAIRLSSKIDDPFLSATFGWMVIRNLQDPTHEEWDEILSSLNADARVLLILRSDVPLPPVSIVRPIVRHIFRSKGDYFSFCTMSEILPHMTDDYFDMIEELTSEIQCPYFRALTRELLAFVAVKDDRQVMPELTLDRTDQIIALISLRFFQALAIAPKKNATYAISWEYAYLIATLPYLSALPCNLHGLALIILDRGVPENDDKMCHHVLGRLRHDLAIVHNHLVDIDAIFNGGLVGSEDDGRSPEELMSEYQDMLTHTESSLSNDLYGALSGLDDTIVRMNSAGAQDRSEQEQNGSNKLDFPSTFSTPPRTLQDEEELVRKICETMEMERPAAISHMMDLLPTMVKIRGNVFAQELLSSINDVTEWIP